MTFCLLPSGMNSSKMEFTPKGKNLLLQKQIVLLKVDPLTEGRKK